MAATDPGELLNEVTPVEEGANDDEPNLLDFSDPDSPLAPYYCRTAHIVAVVVLGLIGVLISLPGIWHTDVWGHLRFGEYMVTHRQLPTHEMFSGDFADQGAPYVNYQWLAQAGAYLIFDLGRHLAAPDDDHQLGGGALLLGLAHALVVMLRFLLLLLAFRRLSGSLAFAVLGVVLVYLLSFVYHVGILRPQILGELAFAALLLALSRPVLSRRALVLVPLVMVFWANSHGSFPIGFVLLGAALAGQIALVLWRSAGPEPGGTEPRGGLGAALRGDSQTWRLAGVLAIAIVSVGLLNPHHFQLFVSSWQLSQHPNIATMEEWRPLPMNWLAGGLFLGSALLVLVLFLADHKQVTPLQLLLVAGFGWQTLEHARMFIWWSMIVGWIVVPHLHAVWRKRLPDWLAETDALNLRKTILAVLTGVVLALWTPAVQWALLGEAPVGAQRVSPQTPLAADAYLREQYRLDPTLQRCIFTSETAGEYLLWDLRLDPPVRITCYTHVHLLTVAHWHDCLRVKYAQPGWEQILQRLRAQFIVITPELDEYPPLVEKVRSLPGQWQVVPNMGPVFVAKFVGKWK